jgi:hypothetical protein
MITLENVFCKKNILSFYFYYYFFLVKPILILLEFEKEFRPKLKIHGFEIQNLSWPKNDDLSKKKI